MIQDEMTGLWYDRTEFKECRFNKFLSSFNYGATVYVEDSVLWYCLDANVDYYLSLTIHERINLKESY